MKVLFQNGDFIRARSDALKSFFAGSQDQDFLRIVSDAVSIMEQEIETDPFLLPADPGNVKIHMLRLEEMIKEVFGERVTTATPPSTRSEDRGMTGEEGGRS